MTILYFLIALSILVAVHEWGHFIVAKLCGVGVETFSIGFGPKLLKWKRKETEYCFSVIPLGGYVKMVAEDPEDEGAIQYPENKWFTKKPAAARLAIVLAGPTMNLILAALLLPLVFMVGKKESKILQERPVIVAVLPGSPAAAAGLEAGDEITRADDIATPSWGKLLEVVALRPDATIALSVARGTDTLSKDVRIGRDPTSPSPIGFLGVEPHLVLYNNPVIGSVVPGTPAAAAGLEADDRIVAIGDDKTKFWSEVVTRVLNSQGKPLDFSIERRGTTVSVPIAPASQNGSWVIGIVKKDQVEPTVLHRYSFVQALDKGVQEFKRLSSMTFDVLKRLLSFQLSYKSLGGPIQIAAASGAAAKSGLGDFLYFMAFLSLQLGILNLLPIPVLDGGHVAFMAIEGIIRRPLPVKLKGFLLRAGMILLLGLMLLVTIHDADILWGKHLRTVVTVITGWF